MRPSRGILCWVFSRCFGGVFVAFVFSPSPSPSPSPSLCLSYYSRSTTLKLGFIDHSGRSNRGPQKYGAVLPIVSIRRILASLVTGSTTHLLISCSSSTSSSMLRFNLIFLFSTIMVARSRAACGGGIRRALSSHLPPLCARAPQFPTIPKPRTNCLPLDL